MKKIILTIFSVMIFMGTTILSQTIDNSNTKKIIGPGTYKKLKNEKSPIKIPFRMHNQKPLMDLKINDQKATLMIDNGVLWDQVWLFGSPLVEELSLKPINDAAIGGSGEGDPTRAYNSAPLTLKFKDIVFYQQPVLVSPPKAVSVRYCLKRQSET